LPWGERRRRGGGGGHWVGESEREMGQYQGKHIYKLLLAAKVPYTECDFCVSDSYRFLHKVDTCTRGTVFQVHAAHHRYEIHG
jgi:hypothetical protein